jgi:hypothetical protein
MGTERPVADLMIGEHRALRRILSRPQAGALAVSQSQPVSEAEAQVPVRTQPVDPKRNPSYPQRVHIHERAHWQGVLKSVEDRVATARQKLNVLGQGPNRPAFERLFAQMLGARDQVADAARRLPMETGDLYAEDRHRLEEAVAALDRVSRRWELQKG